MNKTAIEINYENLVVYDKTGILINQIQVNSLIKLKRHIKIIHKMKFFIDTGRYYNFTVNIVTLN